MQNVAARHRTACHEASTSTSTTFTSTSTFTTAAAASFFRGLGQKESFSQLVAGLYFVYDAMGTEFAATAVSAARAAEFGRRGWHRCHARLLPPPPTAPPAGPDPPSPPPLTPASPSQNEGVRNLDMPALRRVPSLEKDMVYYFGDDWKSAVKPSRGAAKYAARVREIAQGDKPYLLIAAQVRGQWGGGGGSELDPLRVARRHDAQLTDRLGHPQPQRQRRRQHQRQRQRQRTTSTRGTWATCSAGR